MYPLKILPGLYSVHSFAPDAEVPEPDIRKSIFSATRTDEELSIICDSEITLDSISREEDFKCMKIEAVLEFSLVGVLSKITSILAAAKVSVFVLSTFNTDYILFKSADLNTVAGCLQEVGYSVSH
ncbi:MAG: ACT domain-containing protein [Opitutales bacterium]|nr:ACT domain-containing protein [Planctomycetota bacterium]MDE0819689.1 ACT domain-containing protein [Opitutales bacterium]